MKNNTILKKGFYTLVLGTLMGSWYSCDLEEYNPSGTTADIVFSTPEGYEKLVNSIYVNLRKEFYGREDIMFMTETGTDLWFNAGYEDYNNEFSRYKNLTEIKPQLFNLWKRMYDPINLCNAAINRVNDAGYSDTTARNAKVAEAHFMRAFYYWHLVEQFGGVTLSITETSGPVQEQQRSTISAFYRLITSDLEYAAKFLPITQSDKGRVCQKAAYHLLSRAYLTMANYCQMDDEMKDHLDCTDMTSDLAEGYFTKALTAAQYLIANKDSLGASLYPDFKQVFAQSSNKNNTEALFVVTHSTSDALNPQTYPNRLHAWYQATYDGYCGVSTNLLDGVSGNAHLMPTYYYLNLFREDMDARYYGSFKETYKCNYVGTGLAKNRKWKSTEITLFKKVSPITTSTIIPFDSICLWFTKKVVANKATINRGVVDINDLYHQYKLADGDTRHYIDTMVVNEYFPSLTKFADSTRTDASSMVGHNDVFIFRFAETYLLAAEAAFGLGQKDVAASYINVLRDRACVNKSRDYVDGRMKINADSMSVDFLLEERARELGGEHMRWYDLKRYGKLGAQIQKGNPDISLFQYHHILRPIPISELEALLNGDEYGQNKGYN
jgi:starch-binding outer membrane protein, SusD/RagB family